MKITLEITDTDILVKEDNDGIISTKHINAQDLSRTFAVGNSYESDLFSPVEGIVKYIEEDDSRTYFYQTQPRRIKVSHRDGSTTDYEVETPYMLWAMKFDVRSSGEYRLKRSHVFALSGRIMSEDDNIYHAPFPNVYDTGKICWGNHTPSVNSAISLGSIFSNFFSSPFNNDIRPILSGGRLRYPVQEGEDEPRQINITNGIQLLPYMDAHIKEGNVPLGNLFPYEVLQSDGRTINDLFREF